MVMQRITSVEANLSLKNVPSAMRTGRLGQFIVDLANPYLSEALRVPILADIRRRGTHDASMLVLALTALLRRLEARPNCAKSQKYTKAWLATLQSPPQAPAANQFLPMSSAELNKTLWPGAFEDGWTGVLYKKPNKLFRHNRSAFRCNTVKDVKAHKLTAKYLAFGP